jgi:hypothetical protein
MKIFLDNGSVIEGENFEFSSLTTSGSKGGSLQIVICSNPVDLKKKMKFTSSTMAFPMIHVLGIDMPSDDGGKLSRKV